ncbi:MAG: iron-sulfur cluster assembly scaffold protein [Candidatus Rokubacteria bacterium]|nr:iron-sulfur cluster assembly scaffold protein [Candidatus Rokubacteria bacterium]
MIYSSVIRERFRRPRFRGELLLPDLAFEGVNPLCGDRIRIECRIADGRLSDARHRGDSCAICAASADLLLEMVIGRTVEEAAAVEPAALLERLEADIRPTRFKCVTLPLSVLQGALEGREVAL